MLVPKFDFGRTLVREKEAMIFWLMKHSIRWSGAHTRTTRVTISRATSVVMDDTVRRWISEKSWVERSKTSMRTWKLSLVLDTDKHLTCPR